MLYRQKFDTFIRDYDGLGYITSTGLFNDRVVNGSGSVFLKALSREPQSLEELADKILPAFKNVDRGTVMKDAAEFYDQLAEDGFLVKGATAAECDAADKRFSYKSFDPKTIRKDFTPATQRAKESTQEVLEKHFNGKPRLTSFQIELTSRCNERCVHCYIPHENKLYDIKDALYYKVLDQLSDMGVLSVTLSGGEPMMHPHFLDFLLAAQEHDFSVNVLSNLTLLNNDIVKAMKAARLSSVQVSLYSMIPEHHDAVTTVKGSFEKTRDAILKLVANDIPLQISCPAMKANKDDYKDVLKWAHEHKVRAVTDYIMMARYDHTTSNLNNRLSLDEVGKVIKDIMAGDEDYQNEILKPDFMERCNSLCFDPERRLCGVGISSACMVANGNVYPCAGWQECVCGNVAKTPLQEIWDNSEKFKWLRSLRMKDLGGGECCKCDKAAFCAPCMVRNANESPTGNPLEINRHFCAAAELNKKIVSQWRLRQEVRSERLQKKAENAYEVLTRFDIKHITIPDGVTEIRNQELAQCHCLESIDIPSSVTAIGSFGLAMCSSLKELFLPESLTYIGFLAFECCYDLMSVNIPSKVQYIGDDAFYACRSLEKIYIPESVELIDGNIFADCSSLTEIAVSEANKEYCSVDGVLYTRDMSVLVSYPMGKKQKVFIVPSTVRKIEALAFYKCDYFEDIVITSPAIEFGINAFEGCTGLSSEKQQALRNMGYDGDFECLDVDGLLTVKGTAAERKFFTNLGYHRALFSLPTVLNATAATPARKKMDYVEKRHERLSEIEKFYGKIKHRCRKTVEEAVRERAYLRDFILKNAGGRKHEAEAFMGDYGKELPDLEDIQQRFDMMFETFLKHFAIYAVSFGQYFEGMFGPQNDGKFAELLQFAPDEALDKALADNKGEMPAMCAAIDQLLVRYGDIEYLDDRGVQKVLRDISWEDLVLALKNSSEGIKDKILRNMSKRAAQMIKDDMDVKGDVSPADSSEAKSRIIHAMSRLVDSGDIVLYKNYEQLIN